VRSIKTLLKIGIPTLLIVIFASFFVHFSSQAATIAAVYVYMNRVQAGLSTGVEYTIAIRPVTAIPTGGSVTIVFPDAEDGAWCTTAGNLTTTGATSSTADQSSGNFKIASALPGTLSGTCTKGSGSGSADTITITGLTALTANTTYGVNIKGGTGVLGTSAGAGEREVTVSVFSGATMDSKTFKIYLISNDSVVVSATVSEAPTVNCTISANSVNLGTLYPGGAFAIGSHTISTSATNGYYWAAYGQGDGSNDAGLWKATSVTKLIPSTGSTTVDLNPANAEGFGMVLTQPAGGSVVPANFNLNPASGVFGALDMKLAGARMIIYKTSGAGSAEVSTVTYGAKAGTGAPAGAYSETVTFVCGGYY
jgi:hypothetical protein